MTTLTVLCVWVAGPVPFTADYVGRLERMVRRFLPRPFRFVCLTDQPGAFALDRRIETIRIAAADAPVNGRGFWAKVQCFNPAHGFAGRMLFLDLDVLIVRDLTDIVTTPAAFALAADAFVDERGAVDVDRYGRRIARKFNSSVMVWDAGTQDVIWTDWTRATADAYSGDQDWIAVRCPAAVALPVAWFPRLSILVREPQFAATGTPLPPGATVVLVKKPKNVPAMAQWPWINAVWGGWA